MKEIFLIILFTASFITGPFAQNLPEGYILQYEQNFSNSKSLADFKFNLPESWGVFKSGGNFYLQFTGCNTRSSLTSLPANIALLNNRIFGDFVLEANVMPDADTSGIREICIFLGLKDSSQFYHILLTDSINDNNHGIFLMKNSLVTKLTKDDNTTVTWKENKWQKIRVERNIVKRTIRVFIDDMTRPVMQTTDYELVMGYVGFGSVKCPGRIDNIKIWAPTVIPDS
jgi:hypothetical protein